MARGAFAVKGFVHVDQCVGLRFLYRAPCVRITFHKIAEEYGYVPHFFVVELLVTWHSSSARDNQVPQLFVSHVSDRRTYVTQLQTSANCRVPYAIGTMTSGTFGDVNVATASLGKCTADQCR